MADIFSRIVLQTTGGDQSAQEIRKIKRAYDEAAESGSKMSAAVGAPTSDPFSRAIEAGAAHEHIRDVASRRHSDHQAMVRAGEERQHRVDAQRIQAGGGAAAMQLGRGDIAGGIGTGISTAGGVAAAAGLAAGGIAMVVGAAMQQIQQFANREEERINAIYSAGISQRLGAQYVDVRNMAIGLQRTGISQEAAMGLFQGLSGAGGRMTEGLPGTLGTAAEMAVALGLSSDQLGAMIGTLQQAGMSPEMLMTMPTYRVAAGSFGREMAGLHLQTLAGGIQRRMAAGVAEGGITTNAFVRDQQELAAYRSWGGLSAEGAAGLFQMAQQRGAAVGQMGRPEDVLAIAAIRQAHPEMSFTEAMMFAERDPEAVNALMAARIREAAGDEDVALLMTQRYLGGTVSQARAFLRGQEGLEELRAGERQIPAMWDADLRVHAEDDARRVIAMRQMHLTEGAEKWLSDALAGVRSIFAGEVTLDARSLTISGMPGARRSTAPAPPLAGSVVPTLHFGGEAATIQDIYAKLGLAVPENISAHAYDPADLPAQMVRDFADQFPRSARRPIGEATNEPLLGIMQRDAAMSHEELVEELRVIARILIELRDSGVLTDE